MSRHVMIDLETLGTGPRSVVTQLGWALFDGEAEVEGVLSSGRYDLDPQGQLDAGRVVDWATIQWWLTQDEGARKAMATKGARMSVKEALSAFERAIPSWHTIDGVWGHGATFDISLMQSLLDDVKRREPWSFRAVRDTRTLFAFAPETSWPVNPVKHDAEQDAKAQAVAVQRALRALREARA